MRSGTQEKVWTVEITIEESADETEAKATLTGPDRSLGGWGRARRNPSDPELPTVGEELAVSRALSDLAHTLLEEAVQTIEQHEGRGVRVHGS